LTPALVFWAGALATLLIAHLPGRTPPGRGRGARLAGLMTVGAVFALLAVRVALKKTSGFAEPPLVLAPWGTGDGLTIRLDGMGLAFLFVPVLLLAASLWGRQMDRPAVWLALAGGAASVFVAANGISFSYALLLFDVLGGVYWLGLRRPNLALNRVLLAVFTAAALMTTGLGAATLFGGALLAFALWLRVCLFPFVEISAWEEEGLCMSHPSARCGGPMVWLALSTLIGVYAAARLLTVPAPGWVQGLAAALMLLNGGLAWLGGEGDGERDRRARLLRLILSQPALVFFLTPLPTGTAIALGLGYTLSLGALWLTPPLGRPNVFERHWFWIYGAPLLATASLAGVPFTLGWAAHRGVYESLLLGGRTLALTVLLLAEGLAFSALFAYWRYLLSRPEKTETALQTALLLTIPFLLPGLAGLVFGVITGLPFEAAGGEASAGGAAPLAMVWGLAAALGWGRRAILRGLRLQPPALATGLSLGWLWPPLQRLADAFDRGLLRLKAVLEGEHYLGWAFLLTLTGILVVILS